MLMQNSNNRSYTHAHINRHVGYLPGNTEIKVLNIEIIPELKVGEPRISTDH